MLQQGVSAEAQAMSERPVCTQTGRFLLVLPSDLRRIAILTATGWSRGRFILQLGINKDQQLRRQIQRHLLDHHIRGL